MNKPVLWSVDERRRTQLEVIARKLNLTNYSQVMNMAIDEFILKHRTLAKPEPAGETAKDEAIRSRIEELAQNIRISQTQIRRNILHLSADNSFQMYNIHPRSLPEFQEYIRRTDVSTSL